MIILGIDPGIAIVGWGVVKYEKGRCTPIAYCSIQTKEGQKGEDRLSQVYDGICEIINKYHPDVMAVEELFWNTNQKTGIVVAEARGVILLAVRRAGIPIFEYTPLQVKQAIVGYGRAEKKQVIMMVTSFLGLKEPPKPDDTADALAVAICHSQCRASRLAPYYNN